MPKRRSTMSGMVRHVSLVCPSFEPVIHLESYALNPRLARAFDHRSGRRHRVGVPCSIRHEYHLLVAPLLEREILLEALTAHLEQARAGQGSLVLLDGEAGSGKTSAVNAFVETLAADVLVVKGHCDPLATPRPLGPLIDMTESSEFPPLDMDSTANPYELFASVLANLSSVFRPTVMIIEDVHWADDATLDMLVYLGRRVRGTKSVIVATFRGDQIGLHHRLQVVLGDLVTQPGVSRLTVEPLSLGGVRALAEDSPIDGATVFELTGGNAFFTTEIIATGDVLPTTVEEAVLARVARLDAHARSAVQAVAVAPRSMTSSEVTHLVGTPPTATESAVHAGVLINDATGYRFRHELARIAVENAIPLPRRRSYHRSMVELYSDSDDRATVAHHAIRTMDPELITRYVPAAARDAAARHSYHDAAELFAAGRPYVDRLPILERIEDLATYRDALQRIEEHVTAMDVANELVRTCGEHGDPSATGMAHRVRAYSAWLVGDLDRSMSDAQKALEVLEPLGDSIELAAALHSAAHLEMLARRHETGLHLALGALDMANRLDATELAAQCTETLGTLKLVNNETDEGFELILRSTGPDSTGKTRDRVSRAYSNLGSGAGEVKVYEPALEWLATSTVLASDRDDDDVVTYNTAWAARIHLERGEWTVAGDLASEVTNRRSRSLHSTVTALGALGRLRVRRGDPGAHETLHEAIEIGSSGAIQHLWAPVCGLAEWHWLRNEPEQAIEVLTTPLERVLQTDTAWGRGEIAFWMWMVGGLDETPSNLATPFDLMIAGDWRGAAAEWDRIGAPYERAIALGLGDADARLSALEVLDGLGARPAAQRLRGEMRADGVTAIPRGPHEATRSHPFGLTARQDEVFALMREGLSNAEIASRLFITGKTVEHHVSAIYTKLDVSSRSEAVSVSDNLGD